MRANAILDFKELLTGESDNFAKKNRPIIKMMSTANKN